MNGGCGGDGYYKSCWPAAMGITIAIGKIGKIFYRINITENGPEGIRTFDLRITVTGIIPITTTSTNFLMISCPVQYSPAQSDFILSKKSDLLAYHCFRTGSNGYAKSI
jgi:hypothetical protein